MGNVACIERDKKQPKNLTLGIINTVESRIEEEKREINLIPKKRDFFNFYKFVTGKKKNEKNMPDMQYFNIKKAKAVSNKKQKAFVIKECRKFHLNKVIRQLTLNEVGFV